MSRFFNFFLVAEDSISIAGKARITQIYKETENIEEAGGLLIKVRFEFFFHNAPMFDVFGIVISNESCI